MRELISKTFHRLKVNSVISDRVGPDLKPSLNKLPREQHGISRQHISNAALRVMSQLHDHGHQAFLVGGGVRDLLLGGHPKDFDVATDATPEQIKALFRNSRIIGRRFKIVHVRFGRETIEVTTFRGSHDTVESSQKEVHRKNQQSARTSEGMLLRDNVYGTLEEDAVRRDFTINALYYTSEDYAVYDYTNGLQDLSDRVIRIIGDPETRYREDPVRMLRAVRFAAKLDFDIADDTAEPIYRLASSLRDIPAARMFEEVLKLFMAGYAVETYQLMREFGLFQPLFPETEHHLNTDSDSSLINNALHNTDLRIQADKPVTPAFIFAALLWPAVSHRVQQLKYEGVGEIAAVHQAAQEVIYRQQQFTAIPKRFGIPMREIWELQFRLPYRGGHRAAQLMEGRRFRAAYDFLLLREQSGEQTDGLGQWWTDYQVADEQQREVMCQSVPGHKKRRRRRSTRRNQQHRDVH